MTSFIRFIPTPEECVNGFFAIAPVTADDVVFDLGSGDGRLLFGALRAGAGRAVGIELDPELVKKATDEARRRGLEDRVTFRNKDILEADLTGATLVLCYMSSRASEALKPKLKAELRPGTRVVMEGFPIHGWTPVQVGGPGGVGGLADFFDFQQLYLYVMPPAPASGSQES